MNTINNYQPQPLGVYGNQHCQSCRKERAGLRSELSGTMDLAVCLGGCALASLTGLGCLQASVFGWLSVGCFDNAIGARSIIDKHLKERKCCHVECCHVECCHVECCHVECCRVEASSSFNAGDIMEAGYGEKLLADIHLPAQFQTVTIESETNSADQGCLTAPPYSTIQGNKRDNGNSGAPIDGAPIDGAPIDGAPMDGAPTDDVNHSSNLPENINSGCGNQGDRNIYMPMRITRI